MSSYRRSSAGTRSPRRQCPRRAARAGDRRPSTRKWSCCTWWEFVPWNRMGETIMPAVQIENELLDRAIKACAPWRPSLDCQMPPATSKPAMVKSEIVRVARERHADLIVLGSRERHGLSILVTLPRKDTVLHAAPSRRAGNTAARRRALVRIGSPWKRHITRSVSTSRPMTSRSNPTPGNGGSCSHTPSPCATKRQVPAKLLSRHWIITDANGRCRRHAGDGVGGRAAAPEAGPGLPLCRAAP